MCHKYAIHLENKIRNTREYICTCAYVLPGPHAKMKTTKTKSGDTSRFSANLCSPDRNFHYEPSSW